MSVASLEKELFEGEKMNSSKELERTLTVDYFFSDGCLTLEDLENSKNKFLEKAEFHKQKYIEACCEYDNYMELYYPYYRVLKNIQNIKGTKVGPWVEVENAAYRAVKGFDANRVENRVAFIEKWPRVRILPAFGDLFYDRLNWYSNGSRGGYKSQSGRDWCDQQLLRMGYILD